MTTDSYPSRRSSGSSLVRPPTSDREAEELLTVAEVARRLSISRATVYRHVWKKLHPVRFGRCTVCKESELNAFIKSLGLKESNEENRGGLLRLVVLQPKIELATLAVEGGHQLFSGDR